MVEAEHARQAEVEHRLEWRGGQLHGVLAHPAGGLRVEPLVERGRVHHAVHTQHMADERAARIDDMLNRVARLARRGVGLYARDVVAAIPGALFRAPGLGRSGIVEPFVADVLLVEVAEDDVNYPSADALE